MSYPSSLREEGKEPDTGDAEVLEVIELLDQPAKIPDPVLVRIGEAAHMELVDHRVLVPQRIGGASGTSHARQAPVGRFASLKYTRRRRHGAHRSREPRSRAGGRGTGGL